MKEIIISTLLAIGLIQILLSLTDDMRGKEHAGAILFSSGLTCLFLAVVLLAGVLNFLF